MKSPVYLLAATTVAFSATVFAFPAFYKRAAYTTRVAQCLVTGFAVGGMTDDCREAVKQNVGMVLGFDSVKINVDFTKAAGITLDSPGVSAALIPYDGLNWDLARASHKVCLTAFRFVLMYGRKPHHCSDTYNPLFYLPITLVLDTKVAVVENGVEVATFVAPEATIGVEKGILKSHVPETILTVVPGQETLFEQSFMRSLMRNAEHTFTLRASSSFSAQTFLGNLHVADFASEASLTLKGCNSFADNKFDKLVSFTLDKATGVYTLEYVINSGNPSTVSFIMGDIAWENVSKDGTIFGTTVFKNVVMNHGNNPITVVTTFTSKEVYDALISTGLDFIVQGFEGSSKNPTVARAMIGATVHLSIPQQHPI
ncbi:hypothetical protein BGX31_002707 [Mortierella sp. GBA43]|nr:hypothetical protein BGX31_002707 [Mortierella sp. GBA43]